MKRIYLDNAATTAPYPAVLAAMTDTAQRFYGNPSSLHSEGQAAQKLLSDCRARMAARLGCAPDELYFTSGGSEADNWAIRGLAQAGAKKGKRRIVTSAFEHHAVLHTLKALEKEGFAVTYLPVHEDGYVCPAELAAAFHAQRAMGLKGGMLVTNPIPEEFAMDHEVINRAIDEAVAQANAQGIHGKATTPFLLAKVKELTGGDSLDSNIQLVFNNARLAAQTAAELCRLG